MAHIMIALYPTVRCIRLSEYDWNDVLRSTTHIPGASRRTTWTNLHYLKKKHRPML